MLVFTFLTCAGLFGCAGKAAPTSAVAAPVPASMAKAPPPAAPRYQNITDELNQRFLSAMERVVSAPVADWGEGGLTGLYYLERDFAVKANGKRLVAAAIASGHPLPRLVRHKPQGLASSRLLEQNVDFAWMRRNIKPNIPVQLSDTGLFIIAAQSAVAACLPAEADYNAKLLRHLDTLPWPADTEWIRYGMYSGFVMHGCLRDEDAARQSEPLVKPLVSWLAKPATPTDLRSYVLFALAVAHRLDAVPSSMLLEFVRAQGADGTWHGQGLEQPAVNQAPLGAYVIAAMLRSAGMPLPQTDFRGLFTQTPSAVPAAQTAQSGRSK